MRRFGAVLIAIGMTFVAPSGTPEQPVLFAQGQTAISSDTNCDCPQIPPVAKSDKPDPRKAPGELSLADLEDLLSNREALYDGDWDKALAAVAHAIDPTGAMNIWTQPAPSPTRRSAKIQEGRLVETLIRGHDSSGRAYSGYAPMFQMISTVARIKKYGEPTFGLRKAAIRAARFLAGDLARVRWDSRQGVAMRVRIMAADARSELWGAASNATAPGPHGRVYPLPSSPSLKPGPAKDQLVLDKYDIAAAALDIIFSPDDKGKQVGILDYPEHSVALEVPTRGIKSEVADFAALAGLRSVFGGSAAGSPGDAVGCHAFTILLTMADLNGREGTKARGRQTRDTLFGNLHSGLFVTGLLTSSGELKPQLKAARAALILAGIGEDDNFKAIVGYWFNWNYGVQPQTRAGLVILRDFVEFAKGPGAGKLRAAVNTLFDPAKWAPQAVAGDPSKLMVRPDRPVFDAWQTTVADWDPVAVGSLCPPEAAAPRIVIFAQGLHGRIMIKKLYVGVPTTLGVIFAEPYAGAEYPVKIKTGGGELSLTARPTDDQHLLFETEEFVIGSK